MLQLSTPTGAGCRRSFPRRLLPIITTLTIAVIAALIPQLIGGQTAQAERPNIVLIMADETDASQLHSRRFLEKQAI
jgi:hypothetical protein